MPISSDSVSRIVENIEDDYMDVLDMNMDIFKTKIFVTIRLSQGKDTLMNRVLTYTALSDLAIMIDSFDDVTTENSFVQHTLEAGKFVIQICIIES